MALVRGNNYFIGKGEPFSAPVVDSSLTGPLLTMGNCSSLKLTLATEKKEVKNYKSVAGGNDFSLERVTGITGSMTLYYWTLDNLAVGLRGNKVEYASTTVTDEAHNNVFVGSLVELTYAADLTVEPTVTKAPSTALVKGTDYTIKGPKAIQLISGGAVADGDDLLIDYTRNKWSVIQLFTQASIEYQLIVLGLNEADSGNPFTGKFYRVQFSPLANLDLFGDDPGTIELNFEALPDSNISGVGLSQYGEFSFVGS